VEKKETNIVCSIYLFFTTYDFLDSSMYNKNLLLICYSIGVYILNFICIYIWLWHTVYYFVYETYCS